MIVLSVAIDEDRVNDLYQWLAGCQPSGRKMREYRGLSELGNRIAQHLRESHVWNVEYLAGELGVNASQFYGALPAVRAALKLEGLIVEWRDGSVFSLEDMKGGAE